MAWHDSGWNGKICRHPKDNTYCVGNDSYPRGMISEERNIEWEEENAGKNCELLNKIPPCIYSCNAFGHNSLKAYSDPPVWFGDGSKRKEWNLPPATTCVWPYEGMYSDDVNRPKGSQQRYNYDKRLENAKSFFRQLTPDKSLIIYYANFSNPFSENEQKRFVITGISRLKHVGEIMFYDNVSEKNKKKYAGGFIWQANITSHYPDEGFCIPYHNYLDKPEILDNLRFFPDNSRLFKWGTREITDDNAIEIIERFIQIVEYLIRINDKMENWEHRKKWLQSCIGELWRSRGAYPGLPSVLNYLKFPEATSYLKSLSEKKQEIEARKIIFEFLNGSISSIPGLEIDNSQQILRTWKLKNEDVRKILESVLCRFELSEKQIENILEKPKEHNIYSSFTEIMENPFIISENYIGDDINDWISFSKIDHGLIPSPETGEKNQIPLDDWRRLRALTIDCLKFEPVHSFLPVPTIFERINKRLDAFPEWRKTKFTENYFTLDQEGYYKELTFREYEGTKYIYLKTVYENERRIEDELRNLAARKQVAIRSPVSDEKWQSYLHNSKSPIYQKNPELYRQLILHQKEVCKKIFQKPLSVITGSAGTGKTTIIKAILQALDSAHGEGTSVQLLAPTGKAADRLRERTNHQADTIHSFLARNSWLNSNLSFKKEGGQTASAFSTIIIDESSMLDLELTAALFRAINWNHVKRLIFVGDPNQLPPIGKGKVFADLLQWLSEEHPDNIGELKENIRQKENAITHQGNTILDLASLYTRFRDNSVNYDTLISDAETILSKIQEGGEVDQDARVIFWDDADDLEKKLQSTFIKDLETITGKKINDITQIYQLWSQIHNISDGTTRAEAHQILSPYRGERFGTEHINELFQKLLLTKWLDNKGSLGGITYFDKVIQVVNRPRSNKYDAFNSSTGQKDQIDVYNGEIGFVRPTEEDWEKLNSSFSIRRFNVVFSRKPQYKIKFSSESQVEENLELAYAISVHKAQGSEFDRVYLVIPKKKMRLLTPELLYTGLTRASKHLTLFIEEDISPLLSLLRPEKSQLLRINSSLFRFCPLPEELIALDSWYEEGKYYTTLSQYLVRSKSEVIIANILSDRKIEFMYEKPLYAPDGTFYLPDFTITWQGDTYYLEHLGMLGTEKYRKHWEKKKAWYDKNFLGQLLTTEESANLSKDVERLVDEKFKGAGVPSTVPEKDWMAIIKKGETRNVEFKQSLRWSALGPGDKKVSEYAAMRAIASFINTEGGGTLFIGISDKKDVIGIEKDYLTLSKKDSDGFLLHIDNLINNYLGKEYHPYIKAQIIKIENKDVCVIEVSKGAKWVYLQSKDKDGAKQEFFIRGTSSSQPLDPIKSVEYIREHWK